MKSNAFLRMVYAAGHAVKRYPLTLFVSFIAMCIVIYMVHDRYEPDFEGDNLPIRLMMTALLGIPLSYSLQNALEGAFEDKKIHILGHIGGIGLLLLYFFTIPDRPEHVGFYFIAFNVCLHLLAAFAPFIKRTSEVGFWEYNRRLIGRFVMSTLFSGIAFGGLSIALLALNFLFNADIEGEVFGDMFAFFALVVHPWIFLSGSPESFEELGKEETYPRGLKILIQFILMPLVGLYLLILYAYGIFILTTWELPKGGLTYLILSFSVAGMLTVLLAYPLGNQEGNKWVKWVTKGYFFALIPLMGLLYVGISTRVLEYGITVPRYYVLFLAIWLSGIILYFVISRKPRIRVVPISLFIALVVTLFGPWGSFFVSRISQSNRVIQVLETAEAIQEGKLEADLSEWNYTQKEEVDNILRYLDDWHHFGKFEPYFPDSVEVDRYAIRDLVGWTSPTEVAEVAETEARKKTDYFRFELERRVFKEIDGYDYLDDTYGRFILDGYGLTPMYAVVTKEGDFALSYDTTAFTFTMETPQGEKMTFPFKGQIQKMLGSSYHEHSMGGVEDMTVRAECEQHRAKIVCRGIFGEYEVENKENFKVTQYQLELYIGKKDKVLEE